MQAGTGGPASGYALLLMMAMVWFGAQAGDREILVALGLLAPCAFGPMLVIGAPDYPVSWGHAAILVFVGATVTGSLRMLVRETQVLTARLRRQATMDSLTDVLNRRGWIEAAERDLARARREAGTLSVALLDLDAFKAVNDTYGHDEGDRVLVDTAQRLRSSLRAGDLVARLGGDEFVALVVGPDPDDALGAISRLVQSTPAAEAFSAGFAIWDGAEGLDELMRRADLALYAAKTSGGARVEVAPQGFGPTVPAAEAPRFGQAPGMSDHETVFTLEATPVKFGPGAVADAGWELKRLGVERALLVTDPRLAEAGIPDRVRESIEAEGIEVVVYDQARVEPTIDSLQHAADFALDAGVDGFVSVGGGSSMDTAKVANLIVSHPAEVMAYVNPPVGEGQKPPSPLHPHLAIPTTSGSGSEATTVAVLDLPDLKVKSGISHRYLRCTQAIVDPELTRTLPARGHLVRGPGRGLPRGRVLPVQALRHARAPGLPRRPPALPGRQPGGRRVVGQGAGVRRALPAPRRGRRRGHRGARLHDAQRHDGRRGLRLGRRAHPPRLRLPDRRAQARVLRRGLPRRPPVRAPRPLGDRHRAGGLPLHLRGRPRAPPPRRRAAAGRAAVRPRPRLPARRATRPDARRDAPSGVAELGYTEDDVPDLVEGAMKQKRLLDVAPREVTEDDLTHIINASLSSS